MQWIRGKPGREILPGVYGDVVELVDTIRLSRNAKSVGVRIPSSPNRQAVWKEGRMW